MRTRKGPKGRTPPGPQHTSTRKEKESCEEREHRNALFRQEPEDTAKDINRSQLSRKGRKKESASGGEKDRTKNLSQEPTERQTTGSGMEETRCRSTSRKSQDQDNLQTIRDFLETKKLQVLSEPHAEERMKLNS